MIRIKKKNYENDLKLHRKEANEGYKTIIKMSKIVKEDPHKLVIAVDLQQALPTPKLSGGPACSEIELWTYNCGIHDCGNDLGCMYIWSWI